jgi:NAD-dependent SIR2 family protein deacetylase
LEEADCIVINTGAGMGVDSGLADYRGNGGQWGQVETTTGESVFDVVTPHYLVEHPEYAWKMFLTRLKEYEATTPHEGFQILLKWIKRYNLDYFALTSNIDGHLQKAGFEVDRVRELHGTLAYFQSTRPDLYDKIWLNERSGKELLADLEKGIFPTCPHSHVLARPNVYMFRDATYLPTHSKEQDVRFQVFLERNKGKKMVVFEIGSGPHVQTVRMKTRMLKNDFGAKIVRINPKDFKVDEPHIGIAQGALKALQEIETYLSEN